MVLSKNLGFGLGPDGKDQTMLGIILGPLVHGNTHTAPYASMLGKFALQCPKCHQFFSWILPPPSQS